ncbi:MAG: hypothetical protein RJA98_3108 [Pseudomonadota bacterium]|jgi:1-acyl-sn-glycerol-3-phosphate acyltransferase
MAAVLAAVRSAIYVIYLVLTVMPWALMSVAASLFLRGTQLYWLTTYWLRIAIVGARWICGVRYRVVGQDNLDAADRQGAAIICPKHQSTWETFAFPVLMPHPLSYVFKRELLRIPFFGWAIGRLDMIHIDRTRRTEAWSRVLSQGRQFMAQGNWVIMFPEGTRIARGEQGKYQTGASRLAIDAGMPLLPIAVTSARCWPRKSFILRPGIIDVSIGPLIHPDGRSPAALMAEVEAWIEAEMRRLDPEAYVGRDVPAAV